VGRKAWREEGKRQQQLGRCMSHRASWDWKEVCDQSIPQLEQGCKSLSASEVSLLGFSPGARSPNELRLQGVPGGLTPSQPTQGSLEKEKGLVLGEAKSEVVVPGTPPRSSPVGGTHVPRKAVPRTTAKGVFTGRNRTLLLTSVVARLVL